jgi:hypothetical protein
MLSSFFPPAQRFPLLLALTLRSDLTNFNASAVEVLSQYNEAT